MLKTIYNKASENHKISIGVNVESFNKSKFYDELRSIYIALKNYRGHTNFLRAKKLAGCDFFISYPSYILEFDESQHFTIARKLTLEMYPDELTIGFDRNKWIKLCENLNKKDNDPVYRDEQRAWYDTLRDFLPTIRPLRPTNRIYSKDYIWCNLKPDCTSDINEFKRHIGVS